jgi:histidine triad (HIT) family protein
VAVAALAAGVLLGGYLFADTRPRSLLALEECHDSCLSSEEVLGLLASVVVQRLPEALPDVVAESERCLAMVHPFPNAPIHYVLIPKKDIKDIGAFAAGDEPYLLECLVMAQEIIRQEGLDRYVVMTNGPGRQQVGYLHWHLRAWPE